MTTQYSAKCLCGAVKLAFQGPTAFAVQCYCRDCQHISGGSHLPQIAAPLEGLDITGPYQTHNFKSDVGNDLTINFCGKCGSPLFKTTSKLTDKVFIVAGALDEPDLFFDPVSAFEDRKPKWG